MIIKEYIYGLFGYYDFTFPFGTFKLPIDGLKYNIKISKVAMMYQDVFNLNYEYKLLFKKIKTNANSDKLQIPTIRENKLLIDLDFLQSISKKYKGINTATLYKLIEIYYCITLTIEHEIEDIKPIDFIKNIRDENGINNARDLFLKVTRNLYDYVTVLYAPYINTIEINQVYSDGFYSYFTDDNNIQLTEVLIYPYSRWMPKTDGFADKFDKYLAMHQNIKIEDLFIGRSKSYLRLENYSMSIINAVISLEVVVPRFINQYLKNKGVKKDVIEDFNNKFGLSVRVKAILKLIFPTEKHSIIDNVGTTIKLRNKIMHDGLTNIKIHCDIDIEKLIQSCDELKELIAKHRMEI